MTQRKPPTSGAPPTRRYASESASVPTPVTPASRRPKKGPTMKLKVCIFQSTPRRHWCGLITTDDPQSHIIDSIHNCSSHAVVATIAQQCAKHEGHTLRVATPEGAPA